MATAILASLLLFGQQPITVDLPRLGSPLLVSDDGNCAFLYHAGILRFDLKTHDTAGPEWFYAAVRKGTPPTLYSRTMNQALQDPSDLLSDESKNPDALTHHPGMDIRLWSDALTNECALVCTNFMDGASKYIAVTEVRFERRGHSPNSDWLLALPRPVTGSPIGARFVGRKAVALWVEEVRNGRHEIVQYLGDRERPASGLKEASRVRFSYPVGLKVGGIVPNSYNPRVKTLILDSGSSYELANLSGKVLKTTRVHFGAPVTTIEIELKAFWDLVVPERLDLSGGKQAWRPLAASGDHRYWLLKGAKGELALFKLDSPNG